MSSPVVNEAQVDPRTEQKQDYPLTAAPHSARRTDLSITIILLGFTFFVGSMFAGGNVGPGFSFWNMLGVIAVGSLLLGAYVAALSVAAQRSGLEHGTYWRALVSGTWVAGWWIFCWALRRSGGTPGA